jgi:hypothetical protein
VEDDNLILEARKTNPHRMAARAINDAKRKALEERNASIDKAMGKPRAKRGVVAVKHLDRSLRDKAAKDIS